jgi:hypothetical protein
MNNYGLKLSEPVFQARPLVQADDVSWLQYTTPGDDQGDVGGCVFWTMAEHAMITFALAEPTNQQRHDAYVKEYLGGAPDEGATFPMAFITAKRIGWYPSGTRIISTTDIGYIRKQPLLAGIEVTDALTNVSKAGCCDHAASSDKVDGYHAMLVVAVGIISHISTTQRFVFLKNWWRDTWGYNGHCIMREDLFNKHCKELWRVE